MTANVLGTIKTEAEDQHSWRMRLGVQGTPEGDWAKAETLVLGMPRQDVEVAAYYRWLHRQWTGAPGTAEGDWLAAEQDAYHRRHPNFWVH